MSNDFIGSIDGPTHLAVVQENIRLRQRVAELEAEIASYAYKPAPDDIEAAIKDAERYRWLRGLGVDRSNGFYHLSWQQDCNDDYPVENDEIDAAIDAAMESE